MSATEPVLLLYDNKIVDATLTGGSWDVALTALKDPRPGIRAVSSGLSTLNTRFNIDFGETVSLRALVLHTTNFTSDALYRIIRYSDAFSTVDVDEGWLSPPGYPSVITDRSGVNVVHVWDAPVSFRYASFLIDDTGNPDGFVAAGGVFAGSHWQPPYNFSENNRDSYELNTDVDRAMGGTPYFTRRKPRKVFEFGFPVLEDSVMSDIKLLRRISNIDQQVFVIKFPGDPDTFNEDAFLGHFRQMSEIQMLAAGLNSVAFSIEQYV